MRWFLGLIHPIKCRQNLKKKIQCLLLLAEIHTVLCLLVSSPCTHRFFPRILRRFSMKLALKVCISQLIIKTNLKFFLILSIYTIWDGWSQKTISRYSPFKIYGPFFPMKFRKVVFPHRVKIYNLFKHVFLTRCSKLQTQWPPKGATNAVGQQVWNCLYI